MEKLYNCKQYSDSDLKDVYKHIDRDKYPDRFLDIKEEMHQRGLILSKGAINQVNNNFFERIKYSGEVELKNNVYTGSLMVILSIFIAMNLISFLLRLKLLLIISILFKVMILILIVKKRASQIIFIKIWSFLLFLAGIFKILSILLSFLLWVFYANNSINLLTILEMFYALFCSSIGFYYFKNIENNIKEKRKKRNR